MINYLVFFILGFHLFSPGIQAQDKLIDHSGWSRVGGWWVSKGRDAEVPHLPLIQYSPAQGFSRKWLCRWPEIVTVTHTADGGKLHHKGRQRNNKHQQTFFLFLWGCLRG